MEKIKASIFSSLALLAFYEGGSGYFSSGFIINKVYLILIILIIVTSHIRYLTKSVARDMKKDREFAFEKEKLEAKTKNSYPKGFPVDSLSYGENEIKFFKWQNYLSFFNIFFVICMYLFSNIFLYCFSYTLHKYIVPFSNFEKLTLSVTASVCSNKNSSIQTCSVFLNSSTKEQIVLSISPSMAHKLSEKGRVTIEFKNSFIGSSPVRYQ